MKAGTQCKHGARITSHEPNDLQFKGQTAQILALLRAHKGSWVPARELLAIASQYSSRVFTARSAGFEIINRVEISNGVKRGFFMLVREPNEVCDTPLFSQGGPNAEASR